MHFPRVAILTMAFAVPSIFSIGLKPTEVTVSAQSASGSYLTGSAVSDAASNPGLVSDCEVLLGARDSLTGSATLNWSADTPITEWEGVGVGPGTPAREVALGLPNKSLTGTIPPELSQLTYLFALDLSTNKWVCDENDGCHQVDQRLWNRLTGPIPTELGSLSNLNRWLNLGGNLLTGTIPVQLGNLSNLETLNLKDNMLTGTIPSELGNPSNLGWLYLNDNQLTGTIPSELGNLSNLINLFLRGNQLTGCIPAALRDVENNDLDQLGLDFCASLTVSIVALDDDYMLRPYSSVFVTATFSEPVFGFDAAEDVRVANGTIVRWEVLDGASVFTFEVRPTAIDVVTVDIAADVVQDSDGNGNTAADQLVLGIPYDDDHDSAISRDEVVTAIGDYLFGGRLTRDEVVQIIGLYLFGQVE